MTRHRLLDDLFETDIQDYAPALKAVDEAIRHAEAGHTPAPIHGNVYSLAISPNGAKITNGRDRKVAPEEIPLADFAKAFAAWMSRKPG